jgi:hypothetical protein
MLGGASGTKLASTGGGVAQAERKAAIPKETKAALMFRAVSVWLAES